MASDRTPDEEFDDWLMAMRTDIADALEPHLEKSPPAERVSQQVSTVRHYLTGEVVVGRTRRYVSGGGGRITRSSGSREFEDELGVTDPADAGAMARRSRQPVRYRPSTGYLPWLLVMCDRELARHLGRLLAELDLTEAQYGVLQALVHLRRASSATLARSVSVSPQAMVGLVAVLERKGFIARDAGRGGRRVEVTVRGKEVYEVAKGRVRALDRSLRRSYTDEEFDQLVGLLERLPGVLGRLDGERAERWGGADE